MAPEPELVKQVAKTDKTFGRVMTGMGFLSPNIIGFLTFTFLPVIASFMLAFCEWDILGPAKFVGISNFGRLIFDLKFWKYFGNTLFFMMGIPVGMAFSLFLAILINRPLKGTTFFRTIFFLPVVSSLIAIALLWRWIYNPDFGLLNSFLRMIGFKNLPTWLADTALAKPAILIMQIWKGAGYNMLLYLAALQGIPISLYEASEIDGANKWQQFVGITWPLLGPTNFFIVIMSIIGGFQVFDVAFVMTQGGPAGSTTTIVYYIYNNAFRWFKMGYASTIAWFLFLLMFIVTLLQFRFAGEKVTYSM